MNREPLVIRTAIVAAVAAIVHLLVVLGVVDVGDGGEAAITTAVDAAAALAIILLVRPKVTPVENPKLTEGQVADITVVTPAGAEVPNLAVVARSASKYSSDNKSDAVYYDGDAQL